MNERQKFGLSDSTLRAEFPGFSTFSYSSFLMCDALLIFIKGASFLQGLGIEPAVDELRDANLLAFLRDRFIKLCNRRSLGWVKGIDQLIFGQLTNLRA
jgi:hypothetical protein